MSKKRARRSLKPEEVKKTLLDGQSPELLRALGLTTARGGMSADAHRKLKQITHFLTQLEPALSDVFDRYDDPIIVDAGAGKSYVSLVLYELWHQRQQRGELLAVEVRPELIERVQRIATERRFEHVQAVEGTIAGATLPERIHMLVALHACDTATDEALVRGIRHSADHIAVVPCCQAELARLLKAVKLDDPTALLWDAPIHRREFGAHLTNVLRVLVLRAHGYKVSVTELTGWEHSLKNELIMARRIGRFHEPSREQVVALLERIPVTPWLVEQLGPPHWDEPASSAG